MLVAKKCKHCGEWLEGPRKSDECNESTVELLPEFDEVRRTQKRKKILYISGGLIILGLLIWLFIAYKQKAAIEARYNAKYEIVKDSYYFYLLRADGKKIWYTRIIADDFDFLTNDDVMYIYDSNTDQYRQISLNPNSMKYDSHIRVDDLAENNGVITIIIADNSGIGGWLTGTSVWQYNCYSDTWNSLVKECSGAHFIKGYTAVQISTASCINPYDSYFDQKYSYTYNTIQL